VHPHEVAVAGRVPHLALVAVIGLTGSLWLATAVSLLSPLCCLCVPSVRRLSPPPDASSGL
jgi:hypothetical protein